MKIEGARTVRYGWSYLSVWLCEWLKKTGQSNVCLWCDWEVHNSIANSGYNYSTIQFSNYLWCLSLMSFIHWSTCWRNKYIWFGIWDFSNLSFQGSYKFYISNTSYETALITSKTFQFSFMKGKLFFRYFSL